MILMRYYLDLDGDMVENLSLRVMNVVLINEFEGKAISHRKCEDESALPDDVHCCRIFTLRSILHKYDC